MLVLGAWLDSHTGLTERGNLRDLKIERMGRATLYKRGNVFYAYFRQGRRTIRRRVDRDYGIARGQAAELAERLANDRELRPV